MTLNGNAGTATPFQYYHTVRNGIFLIRKHATNCGQGVIATIAHLAPALVLSLAQVLLGRKQKAQGIWTGIRDGFRVHL